MTITTVNKPVKSKRYSIIIPAAGMSNRMKTYGPKCLLDINGKTLIEKQIANIEHNLSRFEIIVVAGYKYWEVRDTFKQSRNFKIVINYDYETTNVAKSIKIGLNKAEEKDIIIIYGDLCFNKHALNAPFGGESMLIMDSPNGLMDNNEVGIVHNHNKATNLMYGLPQKWAQIAYFKGMELELLRNVLGDNENNEYDKCFGFEVINEIIKRGGNFRAVCPNKIKCFDIDSSNDLNKLDLL